MLFGVGEFIPDAPDRENELRIVRILFNLGPQAVDVRIDRSVVTFVRVIPDFLE